MASGIKTEKQQINSQALCPSQTSDWSNFPSPQDIVSKIKATK